MRFILKKKKITYIDINSINTINELKEIEKFPNDILINIEKCHEKFLKDKESIEKKISSSKERKDEIESQIKNLDNETRLIFDDLVRNLNHDDSLNEEFQEYLILNRMFPENEKHIVLIDYERNIENSLKLLDRNINVDKKNIINNKNQSVNIDLNIKTVNHNHNLNRAKNSPLNDKKIRSNSSSSKYLSKDVSITYNKSYYILKSKRLEDKVFNPRSKSIDELGGERCCRKLKHNYIYEIKNSENKV